MKPNRVAERLIEKVLVLTAFSSIAILFLITFFIFKEGLPFLLKTGLSNMLASSDWMPTKGKFGL